MKTILRQASLWLACLSLPVSLQAATSDVMSLEELLKAEVVQGASKYEQKVSEAPASTSIVTKRDIRAFGWRTLRDVLNAVRGFYFTDDRYYSYVGVRGFAPPGDYNTNVLVTIDGHRLNENIFDSTGYGWDFVLDMENVERIEIIRGPGSSLYGSNAVFAVINVTTKKPHGPYSGEAVGEIGGLGTSRGYLGLGNGDSPVVWTASASAYYRHGNERLYFPELDSPETHHGVAEDLDGERQRRAYASATWGHWTLQGLYNHRWRSIPTGAFDTDFNVPGTYGLDRRGYLDLSYAGETEAETYLTGRAFLDNYIYQGDYIVDGVVNRDRIEGDWFGGEAQVITRKLPRQTLIAGLEGRHNVHQYQENFDVGGMSYLLVDEHSSQWAAFLQDEVRILSGLLGYVGIRYDDPGYRTGTFMPRAALVYALDEKTTCKALYGSSYRAPNQYEMFYADNVTYLPSQDLKPETIRTYELLVRRVLTPRFSTEVSGFVYKMKNLLAFNEADPEVAVLRTVNLSEVTTKGLEALLHYRDASGLAGHLVYNYQDTRFALTGSRLVNAPRHIGKVDVIAPLWGEKVLGGLEWLVMSDRLTTHGSLVGGYGVMNLNVSSEDWPVKGVGLSAGVRNICDRKYLDPVSDMQTENTLAQDGRTLHLRVSTRF